MTAGSRLFFGLMLCVVVAICSAKLPHRRHHERQDRSKRHDIEVPKNIDARENEISKDGNDVTSNDDLISSSDELVEHITKIDDETETAFQERRKNCKPKSIKDANGRHVSWSYNKECPEKPLFNNRLGHLRIPSSPPVIPKDIPFNLKKLYPVNKT